MSSICSFVVCSSLLASACLQLILAMPTSEPPATQLVSYVEPLFLDMTVHEVVTNTSVLPALDPWATDYVEALRDRRYGDAIWARYHITGDVHNGIVSGTVNTTVLESMAEDATEYRVDDPDFYAKAMSLYSSSNVTDGHPEILDLLSRIANEDEATLQRRITYGISCSKDYLALRSDCAATLRYLSRARSDLGNERSVGRCGTCNLRLGRYRSSRSDMSYYQTRAVGLLIEDQCGFVEACCRDIKVSGWSAENSGHRKVCLSSKVTGCS